VPGSIMIMAVSSEAAKAIPALKPYAFTVVNNKLLIVNPNSRKRPFGPTALKT